MSERSNELAGGRDRGDRLMLIGKDLFRMGQAVTIHGPCV